MTKFGVPEWGSLNRLLQNSNFSSIQAMTHETFRIGKYKGKIKYDGIEGYRNGLPQTGVPKFKIFKHLSWFFFQISNK